jgi:hypothetical protein
MLSRWMKNDLQLFRIENSNQMRHSRTLSVFLVTTFVLVNLCTLLLATNSPKPWRTVLLFIPVNLAILLAYFLLRRFHLSLATSVFLVSVWGTITFIAIYQHGGITNPAVASYLLVILAAGLFIGTTSALLYTGLSWAALLSIYLAQTQASSQLPLHRSHPERALLMHSLIFLMGVALINTALHGVNNALSTAQFHEDNLIEKNRQLQEVLAAWNNGSRIAPVKSFSKNSSTRRWLITARSRLSPWISNTAFSHVIQPSNHYLAIRMLNLSVKTWTI